MKRLSLILGVIMAITACNRNPFMKDWNNQYGFPPFDKIKTSDYVPAIKAGIKQQDKEIKAIVDNQEAATFDNTIAAYELSGETLAKVCGVLYNLSESDATAQMQQVMEQVTPMLAEHNDNIFMNKAFFEKVKAVFAASESLTREQQMVTKKIYNKFVFNGIGLNEADQAKLRDINKRLAVLSQQFGNNLLAENNAFEKEIGVPVSNYPTFMTTCADRAKREAAFKAYSSRGNHNNQTDNKNVLLEIMKLRTQKAQLMGFECSADFILQDKMAQNHQTVDSFLVKIMGPAVAKAKEELKDMQAFMDQDIAAGRVASGTKIQPWDWFYYAEKVRKAKYSLDENETKPYFKLSNVRNGAFKAAERLYGIHIEKIGGLPLYNPEVETFKVIDADGSLLGIFMTDYLPRSVKRGGAWMNNFRDQYIGADGKDVRPIIVNVGSLGAADDSLHLLTVDEVQTVFHEFGHALHGLLTKCHYRDVSGTNVARDFVECFSQFNENWAFQPEILATYAFNYKTGKVIPDSLVAKINNSLVFNQGFATTELCAASILDMKWHELTSDTDWDHFNVAAFESKVCLEMGLISEIIPRYRSTYFNHIFNSDYNAGYYSYLWSEVLDKDAFEYFQQKGIFNPAVAKSFRQIFLERGGSEEPMTLYRQFRGADPDPAALLRGRGLE